MKLEIPIKEECLLRKTLQLFITSLFMIGILAGCQNNIEKPLQDGNYSVIFDKPDPTNWKAFMSLEILNGEITSVNYDYEGTGENQGTLKSEDKAYNEAMLATKGTNPVIYLDQLEKALLLHQNPDEVDTVSGATTSSKDFRTFSTALLKAAQEGNEELIIVKQHE